ncbi:MAG: hypothetical protein HRU17_17180 [Polyangiaceae bacterium]|nr:hypothetical protein [Polyangiaceae bacterium]
MAGGLDGSLGDAGPATVCGNPAEARIRVKDKQYNNECGCVEADGPLCTIPVGTEVVWLFVDGTEHNVQSVADSFGVSDDLVAGRFRHTFDTLGRFEYRCSLHANAMSGYAIEVR